MQFRLAKPCDCRQLAGIYLACAEGTEEAEGFAYKLGGVFLRQYFRFLLEEKRSLVVCAVDGRSPGRVLGFATATLDAAENMQSFRRHRFRFALAAMVSLLRRPGLLRGLWVRYRATAPQPTGQQYVIDSGARIIYWGVLPSARAGLGGLTLLRKLVALMRLFGAAEIRLELNTANMQAQRAHLLFGAEVEREFVTPDGTARVILKYPAAAAQAAGKVAQHVPTQRALNG